MALTTEQIQQIKTKFEEQFSSEEQKQILATLTGSGDKPTERPADEASRFLLSIANGEDQQAKQDEEAVKHLTRLVEGS